MAASRAKKLTAGDVYDGPMAVFDDASVGHVKAFYALDDTGKKLLKQAGKPVRLVHVDLAPGQEDDGSQEFRVAAKDDPSQIVDQSRLVELQPDQAEGAADLDPAGGGN